MKYLTKIMAFCVLCLYVINAEAQDSISSRFVELFNHNQYEESEKYLRSNKQNYIYRYGIYSYSFGVSYSRMNKYYQDKTINLKDSIIEDVHVVLNSLLAGNDTTISYQNDWGDFLVFCSNTAAANGKYIKLCEDAADWYYQEMGIEKLFNYLLILNPLAQYYQSLGQADSAVAIIGKAQRLARQYNNYPVLAETYYLQGTFLYSKNDLGGASDYWDYSLDYFDSIPDKANYAGYIKTLNGLTLAYFMIGNYSKSLSYAKQYQKASAEKYGVQSSYYAAALCLIAKNQYNLQETDSAIVNLKVAVRICENNPSIDSQLKSDISQTYRQINNINESTTHIMSGIDNNVALNDSIASLLDTDATSMIVAHKDKDALEIYEKLFPYYETRLNNQNVETFVRITSQMIGCYESIGEYAKAEIVVNKCLEDLFKNNLKTYQLRALYASYGLVSFYLQNYGVAINNLTISKQLYEKVGDTQSIEYAKVLANLASCFTQTNQLLKAKLYVDEAYNIMSVDSTLSNRSLALVANTLGLIYTNLKYYEKALDIYQHLVDYTERNNFNEEYSLAAGNLGDLYLLKGEYAKAMELLHSSLHSATNANTRRTMWREYLFAMVLSDSPTFITELQRFNKEERINLANLIGTFSENEWENYWIEGSQSLVSLNNVGLNKPSCSSDLRIMAYDNTLYVKNMLLSSSNIFDRISRTSTDSNVKASYMHIKELKNKLSDKLTPKDSLSKIRQLISVEQKNISRSINLEKYLTNVSPTFKDVVSSLNDNEVALEFVNIPFIKTLSNYQADYGANYGALVFRKRFDSPSVVILCNEDSLNDLLENDKGEYDLAIYDTDSTKLYGMLWKPLENILHKGDIVYYSTTGELGRISHEALSMGKKRLDDYYDLRPVTSTANIINLKNKQVKYQSAVVYGGINFDEPIVDMVAESKKYEKLEPDNNNLLATRGALDRQGWHELPGTLAEANNVSKKLEEMPIKVSLYEGNAANEESFKSMDGNAPDILHIATHGFSEASIEDTKSTYLQNATSNSSMNLSMQLSGLLFAGANNTWKGNFPQNAEDGILTADEISRLDLSNSKLVVLSACKTALGVTDYVDGVFGLQRGFKRAGVGSMVMSLWPVDDNATEKLMDLFYDNICHGKEAHQAFREAQQFLKKQMPSPYYWAGFVMID